MPIFPAGTCVLTKYSDLDYNQLMIVADSASAWVGGWRHDYDSEMREWPPQPPRQMCCSSNLPAPLLAHISMHPAIKQSHLAGGRSPAPHPTPHYPTLAPPTHPTPNPPTHTTTVVTITPFRAPQSDASSQQMWLLSFQG